MLPLKLFASTVCLFITCLVASHKAHGVGGFSTINYQMSSGVLSGYSETWKDPFDAPWLGDCPLYEENPEFPGYPTLLCYFHEIDSVAVHVNVYSPLGLHYSASSEWDWWHATTSYMFPATDIGGTWTVVADHWANVAVSLIFCDLFDLGWPQYMCIPWDQYYEDQTVGLTSDEAVVPLNCTAAEVDEAVIDELATWTVLPQYEGPPAHEPYERGFKIACIPPGVPFTYEFEDAFGLHWPPSKPNADPCKTPGLTLPTDLPPIALVHSHPYFLTPQEYNAGLGCFEQEIPLQGSGPFLSAQNSSNQSFSENDDGVVLGMRIPLYLRTPYSNGNYKIWRQDPPASPESDELPDPVLVLGNP